MNIIFLGMPMSGKTTIGRIVAEKLQFKFYDSDELIAEEQNVSIGAVIEKNGEKYFRTQEKRLIKNYLSIDSHVISIGGGAANKTTKEIIKKYTHRVWLRCSIEELVGRYKPNQMDRPLLYNTTNIEEELKNYDIFPDVYGRAKSYASIYGKMLTRNKSFNEIFFFIGS